ncbi:SRPBCC family protein [Hansschlegelia sp. KR7-227]|uniref:SRPBCC family protein n=1 Tax=Hansschlegelia sp. KR7-227 TaxID=3400914 RepID=UPI003C1282B9
MTAATAAASEEDPNARMGAVTGPREVTFVRMLPGPIERVWAYLTESEKRAQWFAGGEIEPRIGGKVALRFHNASLTGETVPERFAAHAGPMDSGGTVIRWDPPRGFAFRWGAGDDASEVAFDLEPLESGRVRLTLRHGNLPDRKQVLNVCGGWHAHLGVLAATLEGLPATRFWSTILETEPSYDQLLPPD